MGVENMIWVDDYSFEESGIALVENEGKGRVGDRTKVEPLLQ